jgi:hypothetical protein
MVRPFGKAPFDFAQGKQGKLRSPQEEGCACASLCSVANGGWRQDAPPHQFETQMT